MAYREWAPLEHLLARLPPRTGLGRQQEVTCLACLPSHLALATCTGSVYWYDRWARWAGGGQVVVSRAADCLQRLAVWPGVRVSCLGLVDTTDLMLAVGGYEGQLAIFQVTDPRPHQPCPDPQVGPPPGRPTHRWKQARYPAVLHPRPSLQDCDGPRVVS